MSRKIATLWDKNQNDNNDRDQEFYVGGSEHSGQQVLGGGGGGGGSGGNRLGDPGPGGPSGRGFVDDFFAHPFPTAPETDTTLPIRFWRNGFTIGDDDELHDYNRPENREFLNALRRGETPPLLAGRVGSGGMIDVKLENKSQVDFKPQSSFKAFSGEGRRLGAP